jgi:competence protein ComEA
MRNTKWDADWLVFSARARRGVLIFLLLFAVFGVLRNISQSKNSYSVKISYFELAETNPVLLDTLYKGKSQSGFQNERSRVNRILPDTLFNPNQLSLDDWRMMGFSEKQTASILNFKERIGGFKSKKDIQNLYVMNEELYMKLHVLIDLPDSIVGTNKTSYKKRRRELNTASEKELQWVKGIGPFFAQRIISYRNSLGGFYDFSQLNEINQLPKEVIQRLQEEMDLNKEYVLKLNINKLNETELVSHPYIRFAVAKDIVELRNKSGYFESIEQVKNTGLIDDKLFDRIKHYITIDENTRR